jgi:tetratricopeptide (TPR) repeat protein
MNQAFRESEKLSNMYANDIRAIRMHFWVTYINSGVNLKNRGSADSMQYYDKAIQDYKTAYLAWPDTSITFLYLAGAYKSKGNLDSTIFYLTKLWDLDRDKDAYKSVGRIYLQNGLEKKELFKTANADLLKLQKNLKEVDKGSYKGDITSAFGQPDSQKKVKKDPKKEDWVYSKYSMTFTLEGERVVNRKIDKPIVLPIDSTKYVEAVADFNKAVDVFEAVKKLDPKDNENLNLLLQAYYESDRTVEATKTFKLAVENEPGNKMNHYILGLLYRTVNDYDGAIKEFSEAIRIDSTFSDAYFDIGATYYNWGVKMKKAAQEAGDESTEYKTKFQAALPYMERTAKVKKDDARMWETLGTIYALLGQTENATKALDEADKIRKAAK